ncbi:24654_t:CDS:1, partial [Racocetra persica]
AVVAAGVITDESPSLKLEQSLMSCRRWCRSLSMDFVAFDLNILAQEFQESISFVTLDFERVY